MLYGVQYVNQLKGSHNVALFETEESAVKFFTLLRDIWNGNIEGIEDWEDNDFDQVYNDAFMNVIDVLESVDWRKLESILSSVSYQRNENGRVTTFYDDVYIINLDNPVDVPA